ncbi:MAG: Inositol-phosphate phosphatase [Cereibacter sp.]|nr:Inositol-phosphate phosphatase [Cereibacter sp.]
MPEHDLALLTDAALAAGKIAMRFWKKSPQVWDKDANAGPVTEADLAVNDMLAARLRAARPDYGWLSEESADTTDRQAARRCFIIDPIDGTRSFIAGEDTFAHSLAVAEEGRVIAAVVYLPALDRLYTAASTCPALRDGQPIRASACAAAEGATLLTTQHMLGADYWPGGVPQVKRSFRASLAFRLCLVAEGRHDGMVTLRDAWEWDIAAGALIVQQAGALATDRFGRPLRFNAERPLAPGVLAAGAALHAELLGRLTG